MGPQPKIIMRISELLEETNHAPLIWQLVRKLLDQGKKLRVRISMWQGGGKPDRVMVLPITDAVYNKPNDEHRVYAGGGKAKTWFSVEPNDDENLEISPQEDGSFLLDYIDKKRVITS